MALTAFAESKAAVEAFNDAHFQHQKAPTTKAAKQWADSLLAMKTCEDSTYANSVLMLRALNLGESEEVVMGILTRLIDGSKRCGNNMIHYVARANEVTLLTLYDHTMEALQKSMTLLEEARKLGDDDVLGQALQAQAGVYSARGHVYESIKLDEQYFNLLAKHPEDESAVYMMASTASVLADHYFSTTNLDKALYWIDKALTLNPEDCNSHIIRSEIAYFQGDKAAFKEHFEKGCKLFEEGALLSQPDVIEYVKGLNFIIDGRYDDALRMCDSLTTTSPALLALEVYRAKGDYEKAYEMLEKYNHKNDSIRQHTYMDGEQELMAQLGADRLREEAEAERNRSNFIILISIISILVVLLVLIIIMFYLRHRHQKQLSQANKRLEEANQQLETANQQLGTANLRLEKANEDISKAKHQLELDAKMRIRLVNSLSRELRGPLTVLNSTLHALADYGSEMDSTQVRQCVDVGDENTRALFAYLAQVNEMTRWEGQLEAPQIEDYIVGDLVRQAIKEEWARPWEECPVNFTTDVNDSHKVLTDYSRVKIVIRNVLNNAYKFSQQQTIDVSLTFDAEKKEYIVAVTDNGPGVPKDQAEAIFERFNTLDYDSTGFGAGLSIAAILAQSIGVRIWLDTAYEGPGARFCIAIPKK